MHFHFIQLKWEKRHTCVSHRELGSYSACPFYWDTVDPLLIIWPYWQSCAHYFFWGLRVSVRNHQVLSFLCCANEVTEAFPKHCHGQLSASWIVYHRCKLVSICGFAHLCVVFEFEWHCAVMCPPCLPTGDRVLWFKSKIFHTHIFVWNVIALGGFHILEFHW